MFKKLISFSLAFVISLTSFVFMTANAGYGERGVDYETVTFEDMYYDIFKDHAVLNYGNNKGGDVVIPPVVEGVPVTRIGVAAFEEDYDMTSVTIPDTVKEIGQIAFKRCKIKSVEIPDSVEKIENGAFVGCVSLTDIKMSENIKYIGSGAFAMTPWLDEQSKKTPMFIINDILVDGSNCTGDVIVPDTIKSISGGAFCGNNNITSIVFPQGIEIIENVSICENLKKVVLPDSVKRIEQWAFMQDTSLDEINIPKSVEFIGKWAFYDCKIKKLEIRNPDCVIEDITTEDKLKDIIICGYENSTAQEFAEKYGAEFEILSDYIAGDANLDGNVTISDAVYILQYLANSEKYPLDGQALINADCDGKEGVTGLDAVSIQKFDAGVIDSLPE